MSERVVKTTLNDKLTFLIDETTSTIFNFKPYNCELLARDDFLEKYNFKGVWSFDSTGTQALEKNSPPLTPLVGVSAIWLNAAFKFNVYSKVSLNKHAWTIFYTGFKIIMYFDNQDSVMRLSSIECIETAGDKFLFGINIIQVDYAILKDENKIFSLPVVYGCSKILKELGFASMANDENDGTLDKINIRSDSSFAVNMEGELTTMQLLCFS